MSGLADPGVSTEVTTPDADGRVAMAAALHAAAEHLLAHPGLPTPYITSSFTGKAQISYQLMNTAKDDQRRTIAKVARAIGGKWEKSAGYDAFYLTQEFDLLRVTISAEREQVCTRRVVGTETVTLPAVKAAPERTEEREVVEWDCDPILAEAAS